jgi:hypothetical protein
MGKERIIGLSAIVVLLVVFAGVLYQRVTKARSQAAVATADGKETSKPADDKKAKGDLFAIEGKLPSASLTASEEESATAAPADEYEADSADDTEVAAPVSRYPSARLTAAPNSGFMPQEEVATEEHGAADADAQEIAATESASDRYGNRYAAMPEDEVAADTAEVEALDDNVEAAPNFADTQDVAEAEVVADEEPALEEAPLEAVATTAPRAAGNPFARSPSIEAAAPTIAEPETPTPSFDQPQDNNYLADEEPEMAADNPTYDQPPARLDNRAVAATAIAPTAAAASSQLGATDTGSRFNNFAASRASRPAASIQEGGKYKLGPNENYWVVSERAYGTGGYFKALAAYNEERHPNPEDLRYGDEIAVPQRAELEQMFPELCPKAGRRPSTQTVAAAAAVSSAPADRVYVVEDGDTLFDIARYELGKASRWAELYELNRDAIGDDIDFLAPGTKLILPELTPRETLTRQPANPYR